MSVDLDKQLDYLLNVLYETALDASRWQEAVELCGIYAGGIDAQMLIVDKATNSPLQSVCASSAFPLNSAANYMEYYIAIDPRFTLVVDYPVGEWHCCKEIHTQQFVDRNEFYQDFLLPNGARYVNCSRVDETDEQFVMFGALRGIEQSPFGEDNILAAKRFSGHLQRALRLQRHTQSLQAKSDLGAMAINALSLAMLIVDANSTIFHLNTEAENLLNNKFSGFSCKSGRLYLTNIDSKQRLAALINAATHFPATGAAMQLHGNEVKQIFVIPIPAASQLNKDWQRPLALVLVMDTTKNLSTLQLLGSLYDLSPAELRIASALMAGKTPEAYAQDAGVTINTVRTQLKSLFSKTGTGRQAELVALLSQCPPLRL